MLGALAAVIAVGWGAYSKGGKDASNRIESHYAKMAVIAEQAARAEEQRRAFAQKEADDKHNKDVATARADADAANDALGRLRNRLASISKSSRNPSAPSISPTTGTLIDVFQNCADRYTSMGKEADIARSAGLQCERYYDSNIATKVKEALK